MRWLAAVLGLWVGVAQAQTFGPPTSNGHILKGGEGFQIIPGSSQWNNATANDIANFIGVTGAPLKGFGAVCNGSTDDSAAITAAIAAGVKIAIPAGVVCNAPSIASTTLAGVFLGPGQIKTSDGNLRGPLVSTLNTQPSPTSTWNTDSTAWNGNLSGVGFAHEHIVTGAATLGQPSSGYTQIIEASGELRYGFNTSGFNNSLSGNSGRTGLAFNYTKVDQYGQGDFVANQCSGIVASTKVGATNYLASPAVECLSGTLFGGAAGTYIEFLGDMDIIDNGFDIAAVGTELNFTRTIATEGLAANWIADRRQSTGSKPLDAVYAFSGPTVYGVDLASATMTYYRMASLSLGAGGSGYTVGDVLTVSGGTSLTPTQVQVATADGGGAVTSWTVVNTGIYTTPPGTTYTNYSTTGGTGTGATISAYYSLGPAFILPSTGGCIQPAEQSGSPVTERSGYYGALCTTQAGLVWGPANTAPSLASSNDVIMGVNNLSQGKNNYIFGSYIYDVAANGAMFFNSGQFTGQGTGKSQSSWRIMRASGTTTMRLTTDQATAGTTNSYLVLASSAHNLSWRVTCIDTTNGDAAGWKLHGGFLTRTAAGNAAYQGDATAATTPDYSTGAGSTATVQQTADTTNQALNTTVVPPNAHVWRCEELLEGEQVE